MDCTAVRAWFDTQEWPLTEEEERQIVSDSGDAPQPDVHHGAAYASRARLRQQKSQWAWRKWRKARRWTRLFACVPFLRLVAVANALGYGNGRAASDIDLFVVTAPRRIWLVRLILVSMLRIFRQRPGEHGVDALCPSFFVTTEGLRLEGVQLSSEQGSMSELPPDPYLLFWVTQLTVLLDRAPTYHAFWDANRAWVHRWLPGTQPRMPHPRLLVQDRWSSRVARCGEWLLRGRIGDAMERWARTLQLRRLTPTIRAMANVDHRVVVTDTMLKFHTEDRRAAYRDAWYARLRL
ncbi:hypothetical protein HY632_03250 [Candidatus Uhrbacteria bacterium]|nr:hypothetical protein [Candidatus Uhrbacteria bacterium]